MLLPVPQQFDWDEYNEIKIWEGHKVSTLECEQLFLNRLLIKPDPEHSVTELRYDALGETDSGRKLFVVFTIRDTLIRVISARNMTGKEKLRYEQAKKEDPKIQE